MKVLYLIPAVAALLLVATMQGAPAAKLEYKVIRLSVSQVGISCLNGADPTARKVGDVVIMSCGDSPDLKAKWDN